MTLEGKKIDVSSIEIDDIDINDFPDFSDAYISYAEFEDGTPLNEEQLEELNADEADMINEKIHTDTLYG